MRMIAIADCRGGVLDFFKIEQYRGQDLQYGDWCFDYNGRQHELERIRIVLKEIKRMYNQEISRMLRDRQRAVMRVPYSERVLWVDAEKKIKELRNDKCYGF